VEPQALVVSDVTGADEAELAGLRRQAEAWLRERRGGADLLLDLSTGVPQAGSRHITLMARLGSSPAGFLAASFTPTTRRARVEALFVRPELRGVGIGHGLFESLRREMPTRGCDRVDAVALPGDRATKNFFEAHGMVTRALVVSSRSGDAGDRS
jgi:GNAT superfamily N-acetyltransferase